jgi:PIN domain nuclease of toxin-antitoxin system
MNRMVIDSHTLLWWLDGDDRLSATAKRILENEATEPGSLIVSAVTFWELRLKEVRGRLTPRKPVNTWPELIRRLPHLCMEEVRVGHWLQVAEMEWENRDPADRIIAATALSHGVPVVTVDEKFHRADSPVKAVW